MSTSRRSLRLVCSAFVPALALAVDGCSVPYPVLNSGGPFEIPPLATREPLSASGARVFVVPAAPPGCLFLGLASGVGGRKADYERPSDARYGEFQSKALVALRNAVGAVGGTHIVVDAEVTFFDDVYGVSELEAVLVRGPALRCPR